MTTFRCSLEDIGYALEAVRVVKYEEDNDPLEDATSEVMTTFLSVPQNIFMVTLMDEKVVGFATAYELQHVHNEKKELFFYEIGTLKAYRRRGVGASLIRHLKQYCIENNCDEMYVLTNRSNLPAMGMYQKAGGKEPDVMDDGVFMS